MYTGGVATIYDIAKATGYSAPTVSKALNDRFDVSAETKEKVRAAAAELGYVVNAGAKMLVTRKSYLVGLVYEEGELGLGIEHPLFAGIMNAFKARMEGEGYDLVFLSRNLGASRMSLLEHCRYRGVEAVLVVNGCSSDPEILDLVASSLPCVSCNIVVPGLPCVVSENAEASRQVVRYLAGLGHRRVAHVAGPGDGPGSAGIERRESFEAAVAEAALGPARVEVARRWTAEEGTAAFGRLWAEEPRPTAVYCAADFLALGVLNACRALGVRVPEDLSVVGFDDNEWAPYLQPPLTTIRQDRRGIGEGAAELLLTLLSGDSVPGRVGVPVALVERASCGAPKID